jgi:hypothetical protein
MTGRILMVAAALAAAAPLFVATAQAADPSAPSQPGVVPDTGQINPGHAPAPWSTAAPLPQDAQPAQEDARAALMMPDNGAPSAGQSAGQSTGQAANPAANAGQSGSGDASGSAGANGGATAAPAGPIGATIQTMPAKFSKRNDVLDHMPIAAWPLPLNEEQRRQIYQAVMADKSPAAADAAALKPAASLSVTQRRDMHPLPESLAAIDGLQGLQYVKAKDKVLLVRPATGIVVDEVAM